MNGVKELLSNKRVMSQTSAALRRKYVPRHLLSTNLKKRKPQFYKGVYNGNYFRIDVPTRPKPLKLPKLPLQGPAPKPFVPVSPSASFVKATTSTATTTNNDFQTQFFTLTHTILQQSHRWFQQNWTVMVLNFGSLCTLAGFTRSDVVELRALSLTGSLTFVIYNFFSDSRRWVPIFWSLLFASVNAAKIAQILHERRAHVVLTEPQQALYEEFFLPHGMTPKQFEIVHSRASEIVVNKGQTIVKQGQRLKELYLVMEGHTRANTLGRHLTAASSAPGKRYRMAGGDSGAWVGEMVFLHAYSEDNKQGKGNNNNNGGNGTAVAANVNGITATTTNNNNNNNISAEPSLASRKSNAVQNTSDSLSESPRQRPSPPSPSPPAANNLPRNECMYTIVAHDDCRLLKWTHEDMAELMERSTDMRAALTRAMTAAIVGKVINFTVSKTKHPTNSADSGNNNNSVPTWSMWLNEWKRNTAAGTKMVVVNEGGEEVTNNRTTANTTAVATNPPVVAVATTVGGISTALLSKNGNPNRVDDDDDDDDDDED